LTVQDIDALLKVLVLDGEIEKLPAVRGVLWDTSLQDVDDGLDHPNSKKKRKHRSSDDNVRSTKRKRKKRTNSSSEESSSDEDESDRKPRRKRSKMGSIDDESPDSEHKRKKGSMALFADDSSSDGRELQRKKQGKKKSKRKHTSTSDEDSPSYDSDASRGIHGNNKAMKRSLSPIHTLFFDDTDGMSHVYRAVREERIRVGWTEAPCCLCPSFDFCKEGGPVNPQECTYYGDWLTGGSVVAIEDGI